MQGARKTILLSCALAFLTANFATLSATADDATSAELKVMYQQDQADRLEPEKSQAKRSEYIMKNDKKRHDRLLELVREDKLSSGDDYFYAAMLMQHGNQPKDYMLAHIFAMAAAQKGNKAAQWLSAASFDRLMSNVGQPQIFGTQQLREKEGLWSFGKIDAELIPDSLRKEFNVPSMVESKKRLNEMNAHK